MAYAAVISLKHTIRRLLNSCKVSILPPSRESLESAYEVASSLQELLLRFETSSCERAKALEGEVKEAVCELEDALETHISDQFVSRSDEIFGYHEGSSQVNLSLDLEEIEQEIDSFTEMAKKIMEEGYTKEDQESSNPSPREDDAVSSRIDFGEKKSKIVGLSKEFKEIQRLLRRPFEHFYTLDVVSLTGMAGIGKTTIARKLYEDPYISKFFHFRVWVTIGPEYQLKKIILHILAQMNHDIEKIQMRGEEELLEYFCNSLKNKRYLIVLDDVWNREIIDKLQNVPAHDYIGSRVLLTTRLEEVGLRGGRSHKICFLDEEESWNLLREQVFGEDELCPYLLEQAGRKIAKNCEGLPLAIVIVARLLSNAADRTPEYWNKVAKKENSIFTDAYDEMLNMLYPNYNYLPLKSKACFLYMGVFPPSCSITPCKLINLWIAEGLVEENSSIDLEAIAMAYLNDLVSRNVVLKCKTSFNFKIKICSLHSVFWHLCVREGEKEKLFYVMNSYASSFTEGIESQRRLCIHNNILFSIREVYDSMESISTVRSLLCTGQHHQYPLPIRFGLRLLRVLDALTIRFYEFPNEVVNLVQLTYFGLTYNGKFPASISKLWNLRYLIGRPHQSIKSIESRLYLPLEIWDMKELKHLQLMGNDLPEPNPDGDAILANLLRLLDVSAHSCTETILERIPTREIRNSN